MKTRPETEESKTLAPDTETGSKYDHRNYQERAGILVLGVGNILLSDEGVGIRAVQRLEKEYRLSREVEVLDGGTSGLELLGHIEHRKQLLLIDAVRKQGFEPGSAIRISLQDPPAYFRQKITPHQLGLSDVLAAAALTDSLPEKITLYGIVPKDLDTGLELSAEAARGVEKILDMILKDLKGVGMEIRKSKQSF
ncbi:MAG: HyaD/HybD family hydrogenase maturation endopeptidase [Desulfohalobiaceae bacterium]|nr:HyaD/HybD family hydrogenase maturation endopeptidase [Desulfohalobiaceae bacterium]